MKRFWCLVLALHGWNAFALKKKFCERALLKPVEHTVRRLVFASPRERSPAPDARREIERAATERGISVLLNAHGRAFGLTFDARPGRRDQGFILRGELAGDLLRVSSVRQSAGPEKSFFLRIAESRDVPPLVVPLSREILGCDALVLAGWTQVKLAMKHRLTMSEVAELLVRSTAPAIWDNVQDGRDRYVIDDVDENGRPFRLVVEEGDCPHGLITAFARIDPP